MGDVKLGKGNIVYDDALDRTLLSEGDDIFRSFRIYKSGDDFIYYEVIWDYHNKIETETFLFSSDLLNPELLVA